MSDIIPGMNEIIRHIEKLEKENKTLKESIVNLCNNNNEIQKLLESTKKEFEDYRKSVQAMYKNEKYSSDEEDFDPYKLYK
jgi:uncharacterized coiled-coil DUF342 family protein